MPSLGLTRKLSRAQTLALVATGALVALTFGIAAGFESRLLAPLNRAFLDQAVRTSASGDHARHTVVVDIDDVSLAAVGQWPWPRYRIAEMLRRIADAKPAAIGLDVLFPEPDRTSLVSIRETFKRDFGVDVAFDGVPEGLLDNDGYLGFVIGQTGVVASNYFYFDHATRGDRVPRTGASFSGALDAIRPEVATGMLVNADAIASQTRATGFVNNRIDEDGVLRRLPVLIGYRGAMYGNLVLATVMQALGQSTATIATDVHGPQVQVGPHRIPVDASGYATLRFDGQANAYPSISAIDVLDGQVRPEDLRGKVVFVGSSAVGLNDVHNTAVDARFPGLRVQAAMAENILADRHVRVPAWAPGAALVAAIVAGLAMTALFASAGGALAVTAGSLFVFTLVVFASAIAFHHDGLFVSPAAPAAVVVTLFVTFFAARFAIERRRAQRWLTQLENARQVTIESMASVAETRDPETGAHIKRTQHYVKAIACELARRGRHATLLTPDYIELLFVSAPLHDIGKVGVPDNILLKPGRLTDDEFTTMKRHADFGRDIIVASSEHIDGDNFLVVAGEIAGTHHEKWDGTGYPRGLAGEDIPLSGRIMAVADIYDALISRRCYKEPFPHAVAMHLMREQRGTTFDPAVVDAFFAIEGTIREIAARFDDAAEIGAGESAPAHTLIGSLATP